MKSMKRLSLALLLFATSWNLFGQYSCNCNQVLESKIYDEFQFSDSTTCTKNVDQLLKMTDAHISKYISGGKSSFGISIPFAESFFNIGVKDVSSRNRLQEIRKEFIQSNKESVAYSDKLWIYKKMLPPNLLDSWLSCIKLCTPTKSITATLDKLTNNEAVLKINYVPQSKFDPDSLIISDVIISGGEISGKINVKENSIIKKHTGLIQKIKMNGNSDLRVVLTIDGFQGIDLSIKNEITPEKELLGTWEIVKAWSLGVDFSNTPKHNNDDDVRANLIGKKWSLSNNDSKYYISFYLRDCQGYSQSEPTKDDGEYKIDDNYINISKTNFFFSELKIFYHLKGDTLIVHDNCGWKLSLKKKS